MNVSVKFLNPRHVDCGEAGGAAAAMQAVGCFRLAKQRDGGDCKERKAAEGPIFVVGSVNSGSIAIGGGGKSSRCRHFYCLG